LIDFSNQSMHNCTITINNGNEYKVTANWIHNQDLDYWKNWNCNAGVTRILISDNDVYSGECKNDYLGTVDDWNLKKVLSVCKRERCTGCTNDLMVEKYAPVPTHSSKETKHSS
jgi:hypothetical protein